MLGKTFKNARIKAKKPKLFEVADKRVHCLLA